MRYLPILLILLFSCRENDKRATVLYEPNSVKNVKPEIVDTISFEENYTYINAVIGISDINNNLQGFWAHDGKGLSIFKYDKEGKILNKISLPTINEPYGLNRITDFKIINEDSIFVYDGEFSRLNLVNSHSEIINSWKIHQYVEEISPEFSNEIVDLYLNKTNELILELSGYSNIYYTSDPNFFEKNTLLYQINLTTGKVKSGIKYPQNSPYKNYLFWSGIIPYIRKIDSTYLTIFAHDEHLYFHGQNLELISKYSTLPTNFPRGRGNEWGTKQKMNYARINRKLNGYNFKIKEPFETKNGKLLGRVYSAPLGDNPSIPDDMQSFMKGNFKSKYYLQIFNLNNNIQKIYNDIEIGYLNLGNLIFIDKNEFYYFLENNPDRESYRIFKVQLKELTT